MTQHHELRIIPFGLAWGISIGLYVLFIGLSAWLFHWGSPVVLLGGTWYPGYAPSLLGSLLGGFWGFVDGFIGGAIIAWVYNRLLKK